MNKGKNSQKAGQSPHSEGQNEPQRGVSNKVAPANPRTLNNSGNDRILRQGVNMLLQRNTN